LMKEKAARRWTEGPERTRGAGLNSMTVGHSPKKHSAHVTGIFALTSLGHEGSAAAGPRPNVNFESPPGQRGANKNSRRDSPGTHHVNWHIGFPCAWRGVVHATTPRGVHNGEKSHHRGANLGGGQIAPDHKTVPVDNGDLLPRNSDGGAIFTWGRRKRFRGLVRAWYRKGGSLRAKGDMSAQGPVEAGAVVGTGPQGTYRQFGPSKFFASCRWPGGTLRTLPRRSAPTSHSSKTKVAKLVEGNHHHWGVRPRGNREEENGRGARAFAGHNGRHQPQ